jgi:hypothetical protein
MIEINKFSGHVYTEMGNVKQSNTGDIYMKCGDSWIGSNGEVVQIRSNDLFNLKTGVSSNFGDPFKEQA